MNRFQEANIAYKIDGYFFKGRKEIDNEFRELTDEEAFVSAKKELMKNIKEELKFIDEITLKSYLVCKKSDFK